MAIISSSSTIARGTIGFNTELNCQSFRFTEKHLHQGAASQEYFAASSRPRSLATTVLTTARIQIDRRTHFEQSLKRQLAAEARELELAVSCPLECVREVRNCAEFDKVLNEAEASGDLVIVDFYSNSCGACKYLFPEVMKLCKQGCGEQCDVNSQMNVVFLKHNVRDEYDDLTDLAGLYSVRTVPMFKFFMNGSPVRQILTRNREYLKQELQNILRQFSAE